MQVKRLRGPGMWQVSAMLEGLEGEDEIQAVPMTIRFQVQEDSSLVFLRAWAWGREVEDEDAWAAKSWLEETEGEILEVIENLEAGEG